jgi:hypothetical protein
MNYHVSSASTLVTCRRRDYHDHFEFLTTYGSIAGSTSPSLCDLFQPCGCVPSNLLCPIFQPLLLGSALYPPARVTIEGRLNQNGELFGKGQHNKCSISGFPGRSALGCGCTVSRNAQMTVPRTVLHGDPPRRSGCWTVVWKVVLALF